MSARRYINRELSWLRFNGRVLKEGARADVPLLERAKFLAIVSGNLDEFFMVRVGKLERRRDAGQEAPDPAGLSALRQLRAVRSAALKQVSQQYRLYREALLPALDEQGIRLLEPQELDEAQRIWVSNYFDSQVMPVLTPRILNPSHPFPLLAAKRIYLAVLLQSDKGGPPQLSLVPVPASLKRMVVLPAGKGSLRALLLEDLLGLHLGRLFPFMEPLDHMPFRITRNTDFVIDISSADSLIDEMKKSIKKRSYGKIVRMEIPRHASTGILERLQKGLEAGDQILMRCDGPLDLRFLMRELHGAHGFETLRYPPFKPAVHPRLQRNESIFRSIRGGDLFFHHPYDSFEPVMRFVREAAEDSQVLAIKQTLYRVSSKSLLIPALARAAQLGKQVTVLVEVRARFDEENNINWCKTLEAAGCHVLYGVPRWKTHSKITLVVRRETEGLRQYVHIGTGNYNDSTAKQYADMGLLTCDRQIGEDAGAFFNIITGYQNTFPMVDLIASPYAMREAIKGRLEREAAWAKQGKPAGFLAKMNSLSDPGMIEAIYEAAQAGVKVRLLVRGICCLRAGAENIEVRSIVGRFLEHARVYTFENDGVPEVLMGSADLMPRNLNKRVELTAPVKDPDVRRRILHILEMEWRDNLQSWRLKPNDGYERVPAGEEFFSAQEYFVQGARTAPSAGTQNNILAIGED